MSTTSSDTEAETWHDFEVLAARIYSDLAPQGAVIRHNDAILGHQSGIPRQIDVSIRYEIVGHGFLTVVQAKDLSTAADVNVVGEFAAVVEDVRANKGVLICRSGFSGAARTLAKAKGIDLCNIHDAQSRKWSLDIRLPILWVDLHPVVSLAARVRLEAGDQVPLSATEWTISSNRGATRVLPFQTFQDLWNGGKIPRDVGKTHVVVGPPGEFHLRVIDNRGELEWREIAFHLNYTVGRKMWFGSFSPAECRGILHYEDDRFIGQLPIGAIPLQRDEGWAPVANADDVVGSIRGTLITTERCTMLAAPHTTGTFRVKSETGDFEFEHCPTPDK